APRGYLPAFFLHPLPGASAPQFRFESWAREMGGGVAPPPRNHRKRRSGERVERLLETASMRLLGLGEGLEPLGDLLEAFLARGPRHARIHVGVFMCLAGDRRAQIVGGVADRLAGRRIADLLEKLEMAVRVAGLALSGRAEHGRDVVIALDVGLL